MISQRSLVESFFKSCIKWFANSPVWTTQRQTTPLDSNGVVFVNILHKLLSLILDQTDQTQKLGVNQKDWII
jgi:hypothetical protein